MNKIRQSFKQTILWIKELLPVLIWVLLIISLINNSDFTKNILSSLENNFISILISDIIASISAWNAINSYIIASSMWELENNTKIISTFLIAWVTVWIIQLPAEIYFFWKRFSIIRNIISFIFAILAWYIIYFLMQI